MNWERSKFVISSRETKYNIIDRKKSRNVDLPSKRPYSLSSKCSRESKGANNQLCISVGSETTGKMLGGVW